MIYTVELPEGARSLVYDGKTKFVVSASSSASALALAKAASSADLDAVWDNADVTEIAPDLEGVTFELVVGTTGTVEVVAAEGDTFADVAADLVTALEKYAGTPFTNPSWTLDTPYSGKLIVDDGTGGIGSEEVTLTVTAADGETDLTSLFVGDVVDEDAGLDNQVTLDLTGYTFTLNVGATGEVVVVAGAGDTIDDVGADLVTALGAVDGTPYKNPSWTSQGDLYGTLLVDDGSGSIGNLELSLSVLDADKADVTTNFKGRVVDQGVAAGTVVLDLMAGVLTTTSPLSLRLSIGTDDVVLD
jgi:hypothetical protein